MAIIQVSLNIHYSVSLGNNRVSAIKNDVITSILEKTVSTTNLLNTITEQNEEKKCKLSICNSSMDTITNDFQKNIKYVGIPKIFMLNGEKISENTKTGIYEKLSKENIFPIFLSDDLLKKKYDEYGNYIRRIFNYKTYSLLEEEFDNEISIKKNLELCKVFSDEIRKIYKKGDTVVIYSLDLIHLPRLLRENGVSNITYSFDTLFPSYNMMKCIPNYKFIFKSLLSSQALQFQKSSCINDFKKCYELAFNTSLCSSDIIIEDTLLFENFLGLDVLGINKTLKSERFLDYLVAVRSFAGKNKLLVNVIDKKNINLFMFTLNCLAELLKDSPNIYLVNLIDPSAASLVENDKKIMSTIECLRLKYGAKIVNCFYYSEPAFYSHIKLADTIIYLSNRDFYTAKALNVSYVAEAHLILSKEINENFDFEKVKYVNHYNIAEFTKVLRKCLFSKLKKNVKHPQFKTHTEYFTLLFEAALEDFEDCIKNYTTKKVEIKEIKKIIGDSKITIVTDYDGTLTNITALPEKAIPSKELIDLLKKLSEKHELIIATGRPTDFVMKYFKDLNIKIYAEHGSVLVENGKSTIKVKNIGWKSRAKEVIDFFIERTPNLTVEHKETAYAVHFSQVDKILMGQIDLLFKTLISELSDLGVKIMKGKNVIEILSDEANKGKVIEKFADSEVLICAGDDTTDEDMFINISLDDEKKVSIRIGEEITSAKYRINSVENYLEFLKGLL